MPFVTMLRLRFRYWRALRLLLAFAVVQPASAWAQAPGSADAEPMGVLPEPAAIDTSIKFATRMLGEGGGEPKNGFYPELANMVTGAGWISVGPGYRRWLLDDRALIDASAGISWRAYKMAQVRFELPRLARSRLALGTQVRWQDLTQITYFGDGPDAAEASRSEYRLQSSNVVGYAIVRPAQWLSVTGDLGWLHSPSLDSPAGPFKRGNPFTRDAFPGDPVFAFTDQPAFVHGGVAVAADTRNAVEYPSRGGLYRAAWSAYRDRDAGLFSFDRYELEAAHFVPLADSRLVIALHGWLVGSETEDGHHIPFYLVPSLGGNNTLRGYTDYRFHDRNLLAVNAEARVRIFTHLDVAGFVDAGNVAPRVGDLDLDKTSVGVGVRLHTARTTFARFDVARSPEGWQFVFRLNDPLRLSRLSRRTATVPFAP